MCAVSDDQALYCAVQSASSLKVDFKVIFCEKGHVFLFYHNGIKLNNSVKLLGCTRSTVTVATVVVT